MAGLSLIDSDRFDSRLDGRILTNPHDCVAVVRDQPAASFWRRVVAE